MIELKDNEIAVPFVEGSNEYIEVHYRREDKDINDLVYGEYKLGTAYTTEVEEDLDETSNLSEFQTLNEITEKEINEPIFMNTAKAPQDISTPRTVTKEERRKNAVNRLFGKMFSL